MQLSSFKFLIGCAEETDLSFELNKPSGVSNDKPNEGLSLELGGVVPRNPDFFGILQDPRRKYSPIETFEPSTV